MSSRFLLFFYSTFFLAVGYLPNLQADDFKQTYAQIEGLLQEFCSDCHNPDKKKGSLDFSSFTSFESIYRNRQVWNNVIEQVMNGEMPPRKKAQPSEQQKKQLITWIETHTQNIDCKKVSDPGQIVIRRLNRSEYNNTIRDLTGLNLNLAKNFPVQGGGGEGFDNNSEVMFFPAIYMEKYLEAAKTIASHAEVSYSRDIKFLPEPKGTKNPKQYHIEQTFAYNVFFSEWRNKQEKIKWKDEFQRYSKTAMELLVKHPKARNIDETMKRFAKDKKVNVAYLENFRSYLANTKHDSNPWAKWSVEQWLKSYTNPEVHKDINYEQLSKNFTDRNFFIHRFRNPRSISKELTLKVKGKKKIYLSFGDAGDGDQHDFAVVNNARIKLKDGKEIPLIDCKLIEHKGEGKVTFNSRDQNQVIQLNGHDQKIKNGIELKVPAQLTFELPNNVVEFKGQFGVSNLGQGKAMLQAYASTEPLPHPMPWIAKGQLLSGPGNALSVQSPHLSWIDNYISKKIFSASDATIKKVINQQEKQQLEGLKKEKDLAYRYPEREMQKLVQKHSQNFDTWPEKDLNKYKKFQSTFTKQKQTLDQKVLDSLFQFTQKAYRRPLTENDFLPLKTIYLNAMKVEDNFQKAARQVIQKIFISPDFLYRFEENQIGTNPLPITDIELANRLSYFIWSSMPDQKLMDAAISGQLHNEKILKREVIRMLKDPKSISLSKEFAAQWLSLRQLKGERRPNGSIFKAYNDQIRDDMINEATLVFYDLIKHNQSILELMTSNKTHLNQRLAKYYQIPDITGEHFRLVDVAKYNRGGLLGLGAIHVSTSYPDRTSPILRGLWILETLLGNPTPPPPEDVEVNEAQMADPNLTMKERFAAHRENPSCAICHDRIDPIGFTMESFDASGKFRQKDGKHNIDDLGELKNGKKIKGVQGLSQYILHEKRDQYLHHFTEKLLGFALGRSLDYYDDCVIEEILEKSEHHHYQFNDIVFHMVNSLPFKFRRSVKATTHANP